MCVNWSLASTAAHFARTHIKFSPLAGASGSKNKTIRRRKVHKSSPNSLEQNCRPKKKCESKVAKFSPLYYRTSRTWFSQVLDLWRSSGKFKLPTKNRKISIATQRKGSQKVTLPWKNIAHTHKIVNKNGKIQPSLLQHIVNLSLKSNNQTSSLDLRRISRNRIEKPSHWKTWQFCAEPAWTVSAYRQATKKGKEKEKEKSSDCKLLNKFRSWVGWNAPRLRGEQIAGWGRQMLPLPSPEECRQLVSLPVSQQKAGASKPAPGLWSGRTGN